jgi:hypothetical protein
MTTLTLRALALTTLLFAVGVLAGCHNPDAVDTSTPATSTRSPQNAGEPPAPPPPSSTAQTPIAVEPTPQKALEAFARLYINWTYRTLSTNQRTLAAMSVGPARLAERQAAASSQADTTISRSRIYNTGQLVSIARDLSRADTWVLVTREQTGGSSEYEGLQATYHVTLAKLTTLPGGYAIEQWLPQT